MITFESLKRKALTAAIGEVGTYYGFTTKSKWYALLMSIENRKSVEQNHETICQKVVEIIRNWDIRRVKTLIDLFPSIVPKKYLNRTPVCFTDENDNWVVVFE